MQAELRRPEAQQGAGGGGTGRMETQGGSGQSASWQVEGRQKEGEEPLLPPRPPDCRSRLLHACMPAVLALPACLGQCYGVRARQGQAPEGRQEAAQVWAGHGRHGRA